MAAPLDKQLDKQPRGFRRFSYHRTSNILPLRIPIGATLHPHVVLPGYAASFNKFYPQCKALRIKLYTLPEPTLQAGLLRLAVKWLPHESRAIDALSMPFYSSRYPTGSHGWGNLFDLGNPGLKGWDYLSTVSFTTRETYWYENSMEPEGYRELPICCLVAVKFPQTISSHCNPRWTPLPRN